MAELKPCPFCGGLELTKECEPGFDGKSWYFVSCLCVHGPERETPETAIEAWNTRPEPNTRALDERVKEFNRILIAALESDNAHFVELVFRGVDYAQEKLEELFPELKEKLKESQDGN